MTRNKLTLMIGLILGGGLLAGGITYAQALDSPFAEAQEPGSAAQTFSFFVDGAFLGVAGEDITKENMSRYGLREVRGVGVTQAWNVASLQGVASSTQATAYSVAQQLVGTAWSILFALILMVWAWGWGGGKTLVSDSYTEAKRRQAEESEKRRAKKAARRGDPEQAAP